ERLWGHRGGRWRPARLQAAHKSPESLAGGQPLLRTPRVPNRPQLFEVHDHLIGARLGPVWGHENSVWKFPHTHNQAILPVRNHKLQCNWPEGPILPIPSRSSRVFVWKFPHPGLGSLATGKDRGHSAPQTQFSKGGVTKGSASVERRRAGAFPLPWPKLVLRCRPQNISKVATLNLVLRPVLEFGDDTENLGRLSLEGKASTRKRNSRG